MNASARSDATAIVSAANPRFRQWRRLMDLPRASRVRAVTLIEGEHLAQAALAVGHPVQAVLVREGLAALRPGEAGRAAEAAARGAAVYALAAPLYDALSPVEHGSGLMMEIGIPSEAVPAEAGGTDALVLDGIQDPGNAGALLRVAAAAGAGWVGATPGTSALWAPRTMRAAMGAHFLLRIVERQGVAALFDGLPGHAWFAADATGGIDLWEVAFPSGPVAWIVGSEGAGLSEAAGERLAAAGGVRVRIPLSAGVESLNVATAAAVCLFERRRQASRLLGYR